MFVNDGIDSLTRILKTPFYLEIEGGVRIWVFRLRNAGVNTECSCHHEGYIQCQTLDLTTEVSRIKTVMIENGVEDFEISFFAKGVMFQTIEIKSPVFKKK